MGLNGCYVLRTKFGNLSVEFEDEAVTRLKWCDEDVRGLAECPDCEAARQIREYMAGVRRTFSFQTKVRGTAFQRAVWERVAAIPYGATATYGEIAAAVGRPGAARAVARACHENPVVIAVPCHRVVGAGGRLTGYNGGTAIKAALLKSECELDLGLDALVGG